MACVVLDAQVSRLEQRIHAVTADNETLQSELDGARRDADRARDTAAATSAGEGLARLPRDKWPLSVLMLVQAAETAAVADIKEQHVSTGPTWLQNNLWVSNLLTHLKLPAAHHTDC